jgi:hypothetical protein
MWVGAIAGDDTLVSVGHDGWQMQEEFQAGALSGDTLLIQSSDPEHPGYSPDACAPLEIVASYQDTALATLCPRISLDHVQPLNIDVQEIYRSWDDPEAREMIVIEGSVTNIGNQTLIQPAHQYSLSPEPWRQGTTLYLRQSWGAGADPGGWAASRG